MMFFLSRTVSQSKRNISQWTRNGTKVRRSDDQTMFLTGATGTLGGCLLYKLALQLPTSKIFVLVRGSAQ
jgi:hypothetical protein